MKILFVCTGNTCRSVLAHQWMLKLIRDGRLTAEVRSAGVAADPFFPVPSEVREALGKAGAEPAFEHAPRRLDRELADWADLILVMEEIHLAFIRQQFPQAAKRAFLLREHAGVGGAAEVPDPIGHQAEAYKKTLSSIQEALRPLAQRLADRK